MNAATLQRYSPGGDIYRKLVTSYGVTGADRVYQAALNDHESGEAGEVALQLGILRNGQPLSESTASQFVNQLITDPLAAPLDAANRQLGLAVWNVLRNPWVLAVVVAAVVFYVWPKFLRPALGK